MMRPSIAGMNESQPAAEYVRQQRAMVAIINVLLNAPLAWLTHRGTHFVPLSGSGGMVLDAAVTSLVLSLLVALFMTRAVRQELQAGRLSDIDEEARGAHLLSRLPVHAWPLGLLLGVSMALVTALALGGLHALGLAGLPFAGFVAFKAAYAGLLGFLVARWAIVRQLVATSWAG